ncbi:hypothetical protein K0M31_013467 [Melipona bicolor]|uniref:Uncharacterized protein n=1 Tax=Melipona bicolor TaxID=60889 RepID=A0AA40FHN9_9HYME|nr:hypothetical protein K0M31_013467 [Melipona bicolor]
MDDDENEDDEKGGRGGGEGGDGRVGRSKAEETRRWKRNAHGESQRGGEASVAPPKRRLVGARW